MSRGRAEARPRGFFGAAHADWSLCRSRPLCSGSVLSKRTTKGAFVVVVVCFIFIFLDHCQENSDFPP